MKRILWFVITVVICNVSPTWSADKKVEPTEKDWNPPADTNLLARIAALPDNTWLKLPPHKTSGDIGWCDVDYRRDGPRIRDYCNRMVWAPERKRAVYAGAGHNVHPYNDVWEYDLAANTWICLYPREWVFGGLPKDDPAKAAEILKPRIKIKDGAVVTSRGAPVRPAHTWWGLCYDSDKRRMVFWDAGRGLMFTPRPTIAKALGIDPKDPVLRSSGGSGSGQACVFTFYPATREWGEVMTTAPKAYESSQLEYIPDQKALWLRSGKTYMLPEGKTNDWKTVAVKGGPGSGALSAYDPESKTILAVRGGATFVYSCTSNTWTTVHTESPNAIVPSSTFCYDSLAKRFVLFTNIKPKEGTTQNQKLWLYDFSKNEWTNPPPQGDVPGGGGLSYYDPARNVTVLYANRTMWVYRCKRAK